MIFSSMQPWNSIFSLEKPEHLVCFTTGPKDIIFLSKPPSKITLKTWFPHQTGLKLWNSSQILPGNAVYHSKQPKIFSSLQPWNWISSSNWTKLIFLAYVLIQRCPLVSKLTIQISLVNWNFFILSDLMAWNSKTIRNFDAWHCT